MKILMVITLNFKKTLTLTRIKCCWKRQWHTYCILAIIEGGVLVLADWLVSELSETWHAACWVITDEPFVSFFRSTLSTDLLLFLHCPTRFVLSLMWAWCPPINTSAHCRPGSDGESGGWPTLHHRENGQVLPQAVHTFIEAWGGYNSWLRIGALGAPALRGFSGVCLW